MATRVLILGAGFGGLELASRLSEDVPELVEVTLIDQSDSFVFGYSSPRSTWPRPSATSVRLAANAGSARRRRSLRHKS
jgi:sulfide:quinone oxidoreductase